MGLATATLGLPCSRQIANELTASDLVETGLGSLSGLAMNLNRRSFLSRFGSIVASVAIAQSVVKSWVREPDLLFNPADYRGAWRFVCDVDTAGWLTMIPPGKFPENTGVENPDWFYAPKEVVRYEPPRGRFVMVT